MLRMRSYQKCICVLSKFTGLSGVNRDPPFLSGVTNLFLSLPYDRIYSPRGRKFCRNYIPALHLIHSDTHDVLMHPRNCISDRSFIDRIWGMRYSIVTLYHEGVYWDRADRIASCGVFHVRDPDITIREVFNIRIDVYTPRTKAAPYYAAQKIASFPTEC